MQEGHDTVEFWKQIHISFDSIPESRTERSFADSDEDQMNLSRSQDSIKNLCHMELIVVVGIIQTWCVKEIELHLSGLTPPPSSDRNPFPAIELIFEILLVEIMDEPALVHTAVDS